MTLTRIYRFAASHRLHTSVFSDDKNAEIFGKCNNPYGHGHDYVLQVSVEGAPDPLTGRILPVADLDRYVQRQAVSVYDHSDLNRDVPGFEGVPTTENLGRDVLRRLQTDWPFAEVRLTRVAIQETDRNSIAIDKG